MQDVTEMVEQLFRAMGVTAGQRRTIAIQMRRKFGEVPPYTLAVLDKIDDPDELDRLFERLLAAAALHEMSLA